MKKALVGLLLAGTLVLTAAPAQALQIIDRDTGSGYAQVSGWSHGYGTVGIMARYNGHADVFFRARCSNGRHFSQNWTDGGPIFRFFLNVPRNARCTYLGQIDTNGYVAFILAVF